MNVSKVSQEPRQHHGSVLSQHQTPDLLPLALVLAGFLCARTGLVYILNPDEILHYLLADQPSLRQAYQASLTTAHPPLFILSSTTGACWECGMASPATVGAGGSRFLLDHFSLAEQSGKPIGGIDRPCVAAILSVAHLPFGRGPAIRAFVVVFRIGALFLASACGEFRAHDGAFVCRALPCAADAYSALILALSLGIYALIRPTETWPRKQAGF